MSWRLHAKAPLWPLWDTFQNSPRRTQGKQYKSVRVTGATAEIWTRNFRIHKISTHSTAKTGALSWDRNQEGRDEDVCSIDPAFESSNREEITSPWRQHWMACPKGVSVEGVCITPSHYIFLGRWDTSFSPKWHSQGTLYRTDRCPKTSI
jgi:hypothetical protein